MPDEPDDEPFVLRSPTPKRRRVTRGDKARMTCDQMREWAAKACGPQNEWTPYRTIRTNALREHLSPRDLGRILDEVCEQAGFDLFRVAPTMHEGGRASGPSPGSPTSPLSQRRPWPTWQHPDHRGLVERPTSRLGSRRARIMVSPFEPVTTCYEAATLDAERGVPDAMTPGVEPVERVGDVVALVVPHGDHLPRPAQQRPWRVGPWWPSDPPPCRCPGAPPGEAPAVPGLACRLGRGRAWRSTTTPGRAPVGCGSSLIRRGRRAGLASLPTPRGRARLH